MLQRVVHCLAARPAVFDALRWLLEAGHHTERRVIAGEGIANAIRVLDLGCGTGVFTGSFGQAQYFGIDVNAAYVTHARRKFPRQRFCVMDGANMGFAAGVFDAVLIGGVLHHLPDGVCVSILKETFRVLRSGGTLLLWEDIPTQIAWNLPGKIVHALDEGRHIRKEADYLALVRPWFTVVRTYRMLCGVCDYTVVVCRIPGS